MNLGGTRRLEEGWQEVGKGKHNLESIMREEEEGRNAIKEKMKRVKRGEWSKLGNLGEINQVRGSEGEGEKKESDKWECIEVVMDSGAVDHVINPRIAPQFRVNQTENSRNGAYYTAANGTKIKHWGEK